MKITEIEIKCFGKLKNFTLRPTEGVNIIYGENESGKSTVMAFLKAMFYGAENGEKRLRFEPWDGQQAGGSVTFETDDGKCYLLTRTFGATKAEDEIRLTNQTIGEPVILAEGQEPGVLLLGMNVKTFVHTLFVGQSGLSPSGLSIEGENSELLAKLTNLASVGDERVSKGEVEKRLRKAQETIDSQKSSAVLPELRKQKHELLDARMEMQKSLREADALRDEMALAGRRRETLLKEQQFLADVSQRLAKQRELEEIDRITGKRDEAQALDEQLGELVPLFEGEKGASMTAFMEDAKQLLDEEKTKQILIEEKQKQFADLKKESERIDRNKLAMTKIVNKYPREIMSAFERYDALLRDRRDAELALEQSEQEKAASHETWWAIGLALLIILLAWLAGSFIHWFLYIVGVIGLVCIAAYWFAYKKGVKVEGFSDERVELNNINEDLRQLNADMRPIFELFNVGSMEEFDREYKEIERVQRDYLALRKRKAALQKERDALTDEREALHTQLRQSLSSYYEVDDNEKAFRIITELDGAKKRYDKLLAERNTARQVLQAMLGDRSLEALEERGRALRGDITLEVPQNISAEKLAEKQRVNTEKLAALQEQLIRQETELSTKAYSEQDVTAITDRIKELTRRIEHYEFERDALGEACAALEEAFNERKADFGPTVNYRAQRLLSGMTQGKYDAVFVSDKLVPTVTQKGSNEPRGCDVLSAGVYDQIYLSLRLALVGLMADEKLPVLLDDSFARFDDVRMEDALGFIGADCAAGEMGQIFLFTCHKRVLLAAKRLGLTDGVFRMGE